jgi:hypothetical protein
VFSVFSVAIILYTPELYALAFSRPHRLEEVLEMIESFVVSRRRGVLHLGNLLHRGFASRILFAVLGHERLLNGFGEGVDGCSGFFRRRRAFDDELIAEFDHAVAADETISPCAPAGLVGSTVGETDSEIHREGRMRVGFRVIEQAEQHVGHVAPVMPEPQPPGSKDA